jgi:hypothetical protein
MDAINYTGILSEEGNESFYNPYNPTTERS